MRKLAVSFVLTLLILQIGIVSSASVNVDFKITDVDGTPLENIVVNIQGVGTHNQDFSESKVTDSEGKVSFSLNQNEIFVYVIYDSSSSYKEKSGNFTTGRNKSFDISLEKTQDNQWNFYRVNNGEIEFRFKSLDEDTRYQAGDRINKIFEIRNVGTTNFKLLNEESSFQIVDSETLNALRAGGDLNDNEERPPLEITMKENGAITTTFNESKITLCGVNVVVTHGELGTLYVGNSPLCFESLQDESKVPEWILNNSYRFKVNYFYEISGEKKNLGFTSQEFLIEKSEWKPLIVSGPETELSVDEPWSYDVELKQYDKSFSGVIELMDYTLLESPQGMVIDSKKGLINWTPTSSGDFDVHVRVFHQYFENDPTKIAFADQRFTLQVTGNEEPTNNAPTIISTPVTSVDENTAYSYDVDATDSDGDALTYSLTQTPDWLSINSNTGEITGTSPEVSSNTDYSVGVRVSDGEDTDTQTYTLTVNDVSQPNSAPTITSTPITEVNESSNYFYDVEASDADGDSLTYSLTQAPNWLSIDSNTGEITGTTPEVSSDTNHDIIVEASDGEDADTQTYTLTVLDVPEPNNAPVANDMSVTTKESTSINITLSASDSDGDSLTYIIVDLPSNGTISNFDSVTGRLTYTPNTGFSGSDNFTFKANDGNEDSNIATTSITVSENNAPVITSTPVTEINESSNYFYDVDASDADGDTLTYSLTQAPNWLNIDSSTGLINVTAPVVTNDTNHAVSIQVSDGEYVDTQIYTLTVNDVSEPNNAPTITSIPITEINESEIYRYLVIANDEDGDKLTYSLAEAPSWLSINSSTGLIEGVSPIVINNIESNVMIEVFDNNGGFDYQNYSLIVLNIDKKDTIEIKPKTGSKINLITDEFYERKYILQEINQKNNPVHNVLSPRNDFRESSDSEPSIIEKISSNFLMSFLFISNLMMILIILLLTFLTININTDVKWNYSK